MASRFSLLPDLIDSVVAGLRATSGFRAPSSSASGITVYDGPEWIGGQATDPDGYVIIGYGGENLERRGVGDDPNPQRLESQIRSISPAALKEQDVELPCVAFAWSGGSDMSATRLQAFAIVDLVEAWLTANPRAGVATGSGGTQVLWAKLTGSHSLSQYTESGVRAVVEFTITAKTRT